MRKTKKLRTRKRRSSQIKEIGSMILSHQRLRSKNRGKRRRRKNRRSRKIEILMRSHCQVIPVNTTTFNLTCK